MQNIRILKWKWRTQSVHLYIYIFLVNLFLPYPGRGRQFDKMFSDISRTFKRAHIRVSNFLTFPKYQKQKC